MSKQLLYYASLVVIGVVFGVLGVVNLNAHVVDPGSVMMVLGGIGLVSFVGYRAARSDDPSQHVPDDVWILAVAVAALLSAGWLVLFSPVSV